MNENELKVQLLPCPFCGGEGELDVDEHRNKFASCIECRAEGSRAASYSDAACSWNTRQTALAHASSASAEECSVVGVMKPRAWLHILHMEGGQANERLSFSEQHLFGVCGRDYDQTYTVTSEPLYTHPTTSASDATTNPQEISSKLVDAMDAKYSSDLRNLIYADMQFDMRGETDLTFPDMARLVDRGWMAEGDENYEFEITDEGRKAIDQAIADRRGEA